MARTTAKYLGPKGVDRCADCHTAAEATVTGTNVKTGEAVTLRVCLNHTLRYLINPKVTVVADEAANVALCACNRFIGHAGRAAHRCTAAGA